MEENKIIWTGWNTVTDKESVPTGPVTWTHIGGHVVVNGKTVTVRIGHLKSQN